MENMAARKELCFITKIVIYKANGASRLLESSILKFLAVFFLNWNYRQLFHDFSVSWSSFSFSILRFSNYVLDKISLKKSFDRKFCMKLPEKMSLKEPGLVEFELLPGPAIALLLPPNPTPPIRSLSRIVNTLY
jgi:hypothetical protein